MTGSPGNGSIYDSGIRLIAGEVLTSPFPKAGVLASQENADFTANEDFDVNTVLGRNAGRFCITNDGGGDFSVTVSEDGAVFTGAHTVKAFEKYAIAGININTLRFTHLGTDSCYRAVAI